MNYDLNSYNSNHKKRPSLMNVDLPADSNAIGIEKVCNNKPIDGGSLMALGRGVRKDYPPRVFKFLMENKNDEIVALEVFRRPITKAVNHLLNLMTLGKFEKEKRKLGYDNFFHLGLIARMRSGKSVVIEKNAVICVATANRPQSKMRYGGERMRINVPSPIKLGEFMERGEKSMGNFFHYHPFTNNCQVFVRGLLKANNLLTPELEKFIFQPIEQLVENINPVARKVAEKATELAGVADRVVEGETDRDEIKEDVSGGRIPLQPNMKMIMT